MEKENQCQNDIQAVRKWRGGYPNVTSPIFPSLAIVSNCKYNQKSEGKGTQVMKAMKVSFPGHRAGQWGTGGETGKTITGISYLIKPVKNFTCVNLFNSYKNSTRDALITLKDENKAQKN